LSIFQPAHGQETVWTNTKSRTELTRQRPPVMPGDGFQIPAADITFNTGG
jgi:hypothetical protein